MSKKTQHENLAIDPANMDTTIAPGDDFFHYANGGWIKNNPIGDEYSQYGAFTELGELTKKQLNELIDEVSALENVEKGSSEQKIRDFYNSGIDTVRINELGISPIMPDFERIDKINTHKGVQDEIAYLHSRGISPAFSFFGSVDPGNSMINIATFNQGGLGLTDVEYYTKDDPKSKEIRRKYVSHIERMFKLTGIPEKEAKEYAIDIMKFETGLAEASMTRLEARDPMKTYNKMSFVKFQEKTPEYDWQAYFETLGIETPEELNIRMPEFFTEINNSIKNVPVDTWGKYLKWNVLNRNANYLSEEIEKADFDFYQAYLSGVKEMKPRWKRMTENLSGYLGEPLGKIYVKKHFPPEAKERMENLVANLKTSLGDRIRDLKWMSDSTREKALEKLEAMTVKVGYPDDDKWIDYSNFEVVEGDWLANIYNGRKFFKQRSLDRIGEPVDRDEWIMPPQTVNAGYIPVYNQIVFPAGILQPPFFFMDADDPVNYGAIGVVIGHEMTHGFDDKGRQFDKDGNLTDWWQPADAEKFEAQTKILVDQFNNFTVLDSLHVSGELTLGENIADNGGLNISWDAMQKAIKNLEPATIQGFTPEQRFFLAYAQLWRQTIRDAEMTRRLKEDVHSPGIARVNAALPNIWNFYKAFGIEKDDELYVAEKERADIW
ncbi:MAG: M13 family metallopeptidase [Bacteroidales bacterium]|nr:M13 family metallopeptidase [Bacteroidales bacterium]MCF8396709.1 M13 family metallopeptidase [Bacteroidales bacterium]